MVLADDLPASEATYEAIRQERMRLPGETTEAYYKRFGIVTMCDQTRGKAVTTPQGHTVQLDPDECVPGTILAEPGPNGGGGTFYALQKGDTHRGSIGPDGTKRLMDMARLRREAEAEAE